MISINRHIINLLLPPVSQIKTNTITKRHAHRGYFLRSHCLETNFHLSTQTKQFDKNVHRCELLTYFSKLVLHNPNKVWNVHKISIKRMWPLTLLQIFYMKGWIFTYKLWNYDMYTGTITPTPCTPKSKSSISNISIMCFWCPEWPVFTKREFSGGSFSFHFHFDLLAYAMRFL